MAKDTYARQDDPGEKVMHITFYLTVEYPRLQFLEHKRGFELIDTDENYEEVRTEISDEEGRKLLKRWGRR